METKNNYAPKTKLYAPFELLKRILPSRESVAPEELEEYDRFVGSKDALGSEYEEFLKKCTAAAMSGAKRCRRTHGSICGAGSAGSAASYTARYGTKNWCWQNTTKRNRKRRDNT